MDTREKIKKLSDLPHLLQSDRWVILPGLFDPLTADQAERISKAKNGNRRVLAVIAPRLDALLTAEARAALVAGLRDVDAVVVADSATLRQFIPNGVDISIIEDPAAEEARSAEFIEFVLARQKLAGVSS